MLGELSRPIFREVREHEDALSARRRTHRIDDLLEACEGLPGAMVERGDRPFW